MKFSVPSFFLHLWTKPHQYWCMCVLPLPFMVGCASIGHVHPNTKDVCNGDCERASKVESVEGTKLYLPPPPNMVADNIRKIKLGMTQLEVRRLLGEPYCGKVFGRGYDPKAQMDPEAFLLKRHIEGLSRVVVMWGYPDMNLVVGFNGEGGLCFAELNTVKIHFPDTH